MTNIHYLPFINNSEAIAWRQNLEQAFMRDHKNDYDRLNAARADSTDIVMLNNTKKELQCKWFVKLNEEIYKKLDAKLADIPDDETVIAAMPEFFWRNINDNQKHTDPHEIINYGKSFSYEVKEIWPDSKPEDEYSFQKLTTRYPNLILFAGTVWWKKDDLIRNSIPIFATGQYIGQWSKANLSSIDGLGGPIIDYPYLNKIDKRAIHWQPQKVNDADKLPSPEMTFNGLRIGLDICLDFIVDGSCSRDLLPTKPDIQLLIAGGMPITNENEAYINAEKLFLRCDAIEYHINASYQNISQNEALKTVIAPANEELFARVDLII